FAPAAALAAATPGRPVLANDIGVLAYEGQVKTVDFYGLGDNAALRLRRAGLYGPPEVAQLARERGAMVGVVQLCWSQVWTRFPRGWGLVEVWRGPRNVVFGDRTGAFIAPRDDAAKLSQALAKTPRPPHVRVFEANSPEVEQFNRAPDKLATLAPLCS